MAAYVYWFAGILPVFLLLTKSIAIMTVAVTLLGDTLAAIVGISSGRHKLPTNRAKSWEGTIAGTTTSLLVALILSNNLPLSLLATATFATVDMVRVPIDDNFLMPLLVGFLLQVANLSMGSPL